MKEKISMNVVNPNACGIDVGSRSHWVCSGEQPGDVKEFGVYTADHRLIIEWLKEKGIETIAMESTGSYWQTLFSSLQKAGFEVLLVCGRQTKNLKGKTDVKDCQWIQKLHRMGLLTGSFLPSYQVEQLRIYQRHRDWIITECSKLVNKMQKSLRLMNFRLDVAISDISGKSGMAIITAILAGERDGQKLAMLADWRVKKSKTEIAKALQGNWNEGLLYELHTCYDLYLKYKQLLDSCDIEVQKLLDGFIYNKKSDDLVDHQPHLLKSNRNQHRFDVESYCFALLGTNLMKIEGVKQGTVMSFLSEVGLDIFKFPTAKHFVSWLRLAPNNKISGGKVLSSRTPKGKNNLAIALRMAANSIGLMKTGVLNAFFKRIAYKKGRAAAITATARKLAVIIWNVVVKKSEYTPLDESVYQTAIRKTVLNNVLKKIKRFDLKINELSPSGQFS